MAEAQVGTVAHTIQLPTPVPITNSQLLRSGQRGAGSAQPKEMSVATDLGNKIRAAITAWQLGDVSALEPLLDPDVELLWWEPGGWDCHGRAAILSLLRQRVAEGRGRGQVDIVQLHDDSLVVSQPRTDADGSGEVGAATVVTFRGDLVTRMRHFRTREEAITAGKSGY